MHFLNVALIGSLAVGISAVPLTANHAVHERRTMVPESWVKRDRLDASAEVPVRIGMMQRNLDKGYDLLMEVAEHDSPRYGQHYTSEEVDKIFAPSQSSVDSIRGWLVSAGVPAEKISQSVNKQWMQFDVPAAELESLLNTEYHVYEHIPTGKTTFACSEYHVPSHVREHVDYITPGIKLFAPSRKGNSAPDLKKRIFGVTSGKSQDAGILEPILRPLGMTIAALLAIPELEACSTAITPPCIAALYNITKASKAAANNQLGIFEDLGDVYSQTDLNLFFASFAQNIPIGTSPRLEAIDGATAPNSVLQAGAESDLDFQISYPIIYPQNSILFQTDDPVYEKNYTYEGFLNNFLDALDGSYCSQISPLDPPYPDPSSSAGSYKGKLQCGKYKPTNVISISYGGQEADLPESYQVRQCNEFMKLGMQGISIVLSSGDSGVAGPAGDDSANGCLGTGQIFSPAFPATCPYITTVGATYLPSGADVKSDAEVAVTRFPSGGGFSNIYPIPQYQQAAVENYLKAHKPSYPSYSTTDDKVIGAGGGIYNRNGRGYPDVSAVGDNVVIFNMGAPTLIGGTSASAPVFAAILTRINEERLAAGKKTIGFVNPVLYSHPDVLHDITTGNNPGCGTTGFNVTIGWDPVTGLGTPNYPAMLKLFMSL